MTAPLLFTPLTVRGLTLRNRIVVSPMCQYQAVEGAMQDWHLQHHARFALGGYGLAFVEATGITRDGRITHGCTGIWNDEQIPRLIEVVKGYKAHGVATGIQIGHSGRRGSAARPWEGAAPLTADSPDPPWQTVGPSALPERDGYPVPRPLEESEIMELIDAFRAAAKRCLRAGFDVIEIHGAHGYLIHSFFSPISNRRDDRFGGDLGGRMTLPLMVAETVREVWPDDRPVFYRASSVDNVDGGVTIEDTVALARELKARGVDVIDCSSGGMGGPATLSTKKLSPGYQVPFAEAVRRDAGIPTMAVGLIMDPKHAEEILAAGQADLIALARELMADPNWPYHAALELGLDDPHSVLPPWYAFYLERRADVLGS
ncbi:MAG: NADH:flavin oxidoreductase/NADH oxidase [Alphaproteobacteria bacterium]|nr:NADH:flavin oxidoreductase/NADH oxidase [Alphaproteobacteria bacterium]